MTALGRAGSRRSRTRLGLLFRAGAVMSLVVPSPAHADATPSARVISTEGRADQLFQSGVKKFDSGDYPAACEDFSESLKLGPKLGTLLNLALCHETTGKPVLAWSEFSHGAVWAAQNNQRDRYEFATAHVRALEPKLPRVVLQLPTDRAIDGIDLDGEPLPEQRWYLPLYVDPGEHRLAITAPGKQRTTLSFRVTTSPTDQVVYVPSLADERAKTAAPHAPIAPATDTRRLLGFVGVGAGIVGIATGATFGILAMTADERDPVVKAYATAGTVTFLAGTALGAAGGWLLWTSGRAPSTATGPVLTAVPQRGGAALGFTTSF